jgi:hypothetical protein
MKARRIVAALALVVFGASAVSLAGAATPDVTFKGDCSLHGTATFDKPYLKGKPDTVGYHFKTSAPPSGGNPNTCTGDLNGKSGTYQTSAYVDGKGSLSCAISQSDGAGAVLISDGNKTYTFPAKLALKGAGTEVQLDISEPKGGQAYGRASFANYADRDPQKGTTAQCNGDGVKSLEFDANFTDTAPFHGEAPAAAASTTTSTTPTPTPSGGGQPAQAPPQSASQDQPQQAVKGERKSSKKSKPHKKAKKHGKKKAKKHKH